MAVISIRLNNEEEKMIEYLSSMYNEDKSTLIKHSIKELYEDLEDKKVIDDYEMKEKKKKPIFISSKEILAEIM